MSEEPSSPEQEKALLVIAIALLIGALLTGYLAITFWRQAGAP